ncbi:MAG TPA: alpha/beta fold hydrolase [Gemmatimonadaceae bacterium]|nr:alpha/beta fold hydrolase [Gemmatimonadaceae bacterium]
MIRVAACITISVLSNVQPAAAQGGGVIHIDTVNAPSLRNNRLGDSHRRGASIYLPPGYWNRPYRKYPVIYLLHGFAANDRAFIRGAYQNLNIRISMDSLIRAGAAREMIVVTPNARNAYEGSFYANSPLTGNWEDFIVRDLVEHMDRKYRTIRSRAGRGIAGHSMGGYGALRIAMNHPDRFSAVYSLSACCLTVDSTAADRNAWRAAQKITGRSDFMQAGFHAHLKIAQAAIYAPDTTRAPLGVRFPYMVDGDSLVMEAATLDRWNAATPLALVTAKAENLRRVAIAFDAGNTDGFPDIPLNAMALDSLLTRLGISHEFEIYDGTHGSRIRERIETKLLPFFSRHLGRARPGG